MIGQKQIETGFMRLNSAVHQVCSVIPHNVRTNWNVAYCSEPADVFCCFIVTLYVNNMTMPKRTRFSVDEATNMEAADILDSLTKLYKEALAEANEQSGCDLSNSLRVNDNAFKHLHDAITETCRILNKPQGEGWTVETQYEDSKTREATFYVCVAIAGCNAEHRCHFKATELMNMSMYEIVDVLLQYYCNCQHEAHMPPPSSEDVQWRLGGIGVIRLNKAISKARCDTYTFEKLCWGVQRDFTADLTGRGFIRVTLESEGLPCLNVAQQFNVVYAATAAEHQLIKDIEELYLRFVNKSPELRIRKYARQFYNIVADVCGRYSHIVRSFTINNVSVDDAYKLQNDKHVYSVTMRNYKAGLIKQDFDLEMMNDVTAESSVEKAIVEMVKKLEHGYSG